MSRLIMLSNSDSLSIGVIKRLTADQQTDRETKKRQTETRRLAFAFLIIIEMPASLVYIFFFPH